MKHILLNTAFELEQRANIQPLERYAYNEITGFWVDNDGNLMINDNGFAGVGSKKFDMETGEDKKY